MASDTTERTGLSLFLVKLGLRLEDGPPLDKLELTVAAPESPRAIELAVAEARRRHPKARPGVDVESCCRFAFVDLVDHEALLEADLEHPETLAAAAAALDDVVPTSPPKED